MPARPPLSGDAPGDSQATHDRLWHQPMRTSPLAASHRRRAQDRPQLLSGRQRYLTLRYEIDGSQPSPRELHAPARKPTDESAQHEPDLGRERNVAGHADEWRPLLAKAVRHSRFCLKGAAVLRAAVVCRPLLRFVQTQERARLARTAADGWFRQGGPVTTLVRSGQSATVSPWR